MLARIPILGDNAFDMPIETIKALRERCARTLRSHTEDATIEADYLVASVLDTSRAQLYAWPEREVAENLCAQIEPLLARRIAGEPLAYVLGQHEFWSLQLLVTPDVLIPRADTERLVEVALKKLGHSPSPDVLDLGTGSGAIALAILSEIPGAHVVATDASNAALAIARSNAKLLNLKLSLLQSNWFEHLAHDKFDLIISNPPYVDAHDPELDVSVRRYEPPSAVVANDNGLADLKKIIEGAHEFLKPDGTLLLEHGWKQGDTVRALLTHAGFQEVNTWHDLGGHPRVSGGMHPQAQARHDG